MDRGLYLAGAGQWILQVGNHKGQSQCHAPPIEPVLDSRHDAARPISSITVFAVAAFSTGFGQEEVRALPKYSVGAMAHRVFTYRVVYAALHQDFAAFEI
jgi:hypothetical protein